MRNKSSAGSTTKSGTGLLGKSSSSIVKSSVSGRVGKSSSFFGLSGKSSKTQNYSDKTGSFFGSSSKSSYPAATEKSKNVSEKRNYLDSSKGTNLTDKNQKSNNYTAAFGANVKNTSVSHGKGASNLGTPEKSLALSPSSKSSTAYDSSRNYPSFITPKSNKKSSAFGIVWLPMRKRNKKKDVVYNSHNYDSYKIRSPSMYNFMSGNSSEYQSQKEKEEVKLLVPEPTKVVSVAVNTGITAAAIDVTSNSSGNVNLEENQKLIEKDNGDNKETANEGNDKDDKTDKDEKNDKDYLENKDASEKLSEPKYDGEKEVDKVDSVYLRQPPAHKARPINTRNEEENCGVTCLYYIMQCCDCVLM